MNLYQRLRPYWILTVGETISDFGSSMATFALDVWVYQESKSVTLFALLHVASTLPGLVLAPLAGAWVDRMNRRTATLLCNLGLAAMSALLAERALTSHLTLGLLYAVTPVIATLRLVQSITLVATAA